MQSLAQLIQRQWSQQMLAPHAAARAAVQRLEGRLLLTGSPVVSTTPLNDSMGFSAAANSLSLSAFAINNDGTIDQLPNGPAAFTTYGIGGSITPIGNLQLADIADPRQSYMSALSTQAFSTSAFQTTFDFQIQPGSTPYVGSDFSFELQSPPDSSGNTYNVMERFTYAYGNGVSTIYPYENGIQMSLNNGASDNLNPSGIQLHNGDILQAHLAYDGTTFSEALLDTQTGDSFSNQFAVNIPASIGPVAYVGFAAHSGGAAEDIVVSGDVLGVVTSKLSILSWTYTPANASTLVQLTGAPIGTANFWNGTNTIYQAFDGNPSTFFDPANGNLTNWVGLDLGAPATITQISFAPRAGYEFRMLDGQFQASTTPDFSSNVKTLYTITSTPTAGQLTTVNVAPSASYRYVRYTGGLQWVNIAEMQVFGYQLPKPLTVPFTGTPIGTADTWTADRTPAQVFDGDLTTFFDPATGNLAGWAGLDMGSPQVITQLSFAPRTGYEFRMVGGQFQVSSVPDFSSDVHTIYTITQPPVAGQLTTVTLPAIGAFRYVRYTGGTQWVNIAEMQVRGSVTPLAIAGTPIGVGGAWVAGSGYAAAFDGNVNSYFDPANGNLTNWVGLDLGSAQTITQVTFAARTGYEFRMIGAQIQVSSTPDFSADVQTIYTIANPPASGDAVTVQVSPVTARYIRYIGGTQWVNIAELEAAAYDPAG